MAKAIHPRPRALGSIPGTGDICPAGRPAGTKVINLLKYCVFKERTTVLLIDWPVIRQTTLAMKRDIQKRIRNHTRTSNVHTCGLLRVNCIME